MRPMTENEQREHEVHMLAVRQALTSLDYLPDEVKVQASIAVARSRLQDWVDENQGRWVA